MLAFIEAPGFIAFALLTLPVWAALLGGMAGVLYQIARSTRVWE